MLAFVSLRISQLGTEMAKICFFPVVLLMIGAGASAQSIYPDRDVAEGRVFSQKTSDGMTHYTSQSPSSGGYKAIAYYTIAKTGRSRINGLLCESDCAGEQQAYQQARDHRIADEKDCPLSPRTASTGCRLWVQEVR